METMKTEKIDHSLEELQHKGMKLSEYGYFVLHSICNCQNSP